MGKTLGTILQFAAAAAVLVTTGNVGLAMAAYQATGALNSLIGLGPGRPKPETASVAIKTSRPPRVSAYGRGRLWGAYLLFETAENGTAVDVYVVHDGKLDGVEAFYLGDKPVTLAGNTVNAGDDGRYKDSSVKLYHTNGSVPGTPIAALVSLLPGIWTNNHRGDGVVIMALTAKAVKAKNFQEIYPESTVPVPSMVARWQACPDPAAADPLNEAAWTWTENPVRHLLHYKLVREGPKPALPRSDPGYPAALLALRQAWWARKIAPTLDLWIAAAADCDEATPLKAGGTEPRYRSAASHKHTDQHKDVTETLLSTFDGWISPRADGALVVYSGRFVAPTVSITPAEIISYVWEAGAVDDDEAANELVCSYISAEHDYNSVECDPWRDENDIVRRGQVLSAPLDLPVPSHGQSRRLAKRKQARSLAPHRGVVTTNVAGRIARGQRYINLHLEEAGHVFFSGPAEVVALTRNIQGGVTFSWVAADPNIDAWNPATEEGEPAAKGDRIAVAPLAAPVIDVVTPHYESSSGTGVQGARLEIIAFGPDRDDLTWFARWRVVGDATWKESLYTDQPAGAAVTLLTDFVPMNASLEVEVAYQVGVGRTSPWSITEVVSTTTAGVIYPGGVNHLTAPEDFTAAAWVRDAGLPGVQPVVTANTATGPFGHAGADHIRFNRGGDGGGGFSRIAQTATGLTIGADYEFGLWIRATEIGHKVAFRIGGTAGPTLNLTTDWQRFTIAFTATGATAGVQIMSWDGVMPGTTQIAEIDVFGAQVRPV